MSTAAIDQIVATIAAHRFHYATEDQLQVSVARLFPGARREVRIDGAGVIDIVVGDVGIECKVAGSAAALIRQVNRYARAWPFDGIVVVTNRVSHRACATAITACPVRVVFAGSL